MRKNAFTLVELLIVIAIIAILSTIGVVFYKNSTLSALDAKRKADINTISKAYETAYNSATGLYRPLTADDFSNGIPHPPEDPAGYYTGWLTADATGFKVCTILQSNPTSSCYETSATCFCLFSSQGAYIAQASPTSSPSSSPACTVIQKDKYGVNLGIGWRTNQTDDALAKAKDANLGWIRFGCGWSFVEGATNFTTDNQWQTANWSSCDPLVESAHATYGLNIIFQLNTAHEGNESFCNQNPTSRPTINTSANPPCTDNGAYTTFKDYLSHFVARYGNPSSAYKAAHPDLIYCTGGQTTGCFGQNHISYWELGNEPDLNINWKCIDTDPSVSPCLHDPTYSYGYHNYKEMMQAAYEAIKSGPDAVDSTAKVSYGGLAYVPDAPLNSAKDPNFLQKIGINAPASDNATAYTDFANLHVYGNSSFIQNTALRAYRDNHPPGMDIWVTEMGYASGDATNNVPIIQPYDPRTEANQSAYLQDYIPLFLNELNVAKVFWFEMFDVPNMATTDQFCKFGLTYIPGAQCQGVASSVTTLTTKQAYTAYKDLICPP